MRYSASEKLEIIRIVEQSHLPVKRTLAKLGVSRPTFYRCTDRSFPMRKCWTANGPLTRIGQGISALGFAS
jgi:hypothetical protein